jgi:hypothetical protein
MALLGASPIVAHSTAGLLSYDATALHSHIGTATPSVDPHDHLDTADARTQAKPIASMMSTEATAGSAPVQFVKLVGLEVAFGRGAGVYAPNANDVTLARVTVWNHGQNAVVLSGMRNTVSQGVVAGSGCAAMTVGGGDVTTLSPSASSVTDTTVYSYARITRTYNPGVTFWGVGNVYSGNTVFDAPHQAIFGSGNNHLFDSNHVHDVCFEARPVLCCVVVVIASAGTPAPT